MKKFMILLLSLAVLFSFAACDNENGSAPSSELRSTGTATLKDGVDYLVGETINPEDFTFTAYTVDGTAVDVPASSVELRTGDSSSAGNEVAVAFFADGVTFTDKIAIYAPTKITVDASASSVKKVYYTTENADYQKVDLTGVAITATYKVDDVEKTKTFTDVTDNESITAELEDWETPDAKKVVTVTYTTDVEDTYKVELKDNLVTSIALKATDDYGIILGTGATQLKYANVTSGKVNADAEGVYVEATYQNGEVKALASTDLTTDKFGTQSDKVETAISSISSLTPSTAGSFTLYVKVTSLDAVVGFEETVSLQLTATTNTVSAIDVTVGSVAAKDYRDAAAEFKALFTVKAKYADGTVASDAVPAADVTVTPSAPDYSSASVGSRQSVEVSATINGTPYSKTVEFKLVTATPEE